MLTNKRIIKRPIKTLAFGVGRILTIGSALMWGCAIEYPVPPITSC